MADPAPPGEDVIDLAHELADAARRITTGYFRQGVHVHDKPDASPVTAADREAEQTMRARIEAAYPHHGIVGEEFGTLRGDAEYVWVLDPIDGTKQFITGKPTFGTLIALTHHGRSVLGVIDIPVMGERWVGALGRRTLHVDSQGARNVTTRACDSLAAATLCCTAPELFEGAQRDGFERLRRGVRVAYYGGDCHNYGLLASGFCDIATDGGMNYYDFAALVPVVEGAGGRITDYQGRTLTPNHVGTVLAAGDATVHAEALEVLAG